MFYDLISALSLEHLARGFYWFMPTVETFHYTGHLILFGCILLFDMRLLGIASHISISKLDRLTARFAAAGFFLAAISGSVLFLANFSYFWGNPMLINKLILMALALINIAVFHFFVAPKVTHWDSGLSTPWFAKLSGAASLLLWIAVISAGRLIAYY